MRPPHCSAFRPYFSPVLKCDNIAHNACSVSFYVEMIKITIRLFELGASLGTTHSVCG